MSTPNKPMLGFDPKTGSMIPLAASVSHPAKDKIRITVADGYDLALMQLGNAIVILVGDGDDTHVLQLALADDEEVVNIDKHEKHAEFTTRVRQHS